MDWENERYVRLYTRRTIDDLALTWEARALWHEMLREFDRAGTIELTRWGLRGLAALVHLPVEVVKTHFPLLIEDGRIELRENVIVAPNYMVAQDRKRSDAQRQREHRARRRDLARAGKLHSLVTTRDPGVTSKNTGFGIASNNSGSDAEPSGSSLSEEVGNGGREAAIDTGGNGDVTKPNAGVTTVTDGVTPSLPPVPTLPIHNPGSGDSCSESELGECKDCKAGDTSEVREVPAVREKKPDFDFEAIYKLYPRKAGKAKGIDHCKQKIATQEQYDALKEAVEQMARSWTGSKKYCPYFSTFVNQRRWEDGELPQPDDESERRFAEPSSPEEFEAQEDIPFD